MVNQSLILSVYIAGLQSRRGFCQMAAYLPGSGLAGFWRPAKQAWPTAAAYAFNELDETIGYSILPPSSPGEHAF